jgi:hypothetical protein
MPEKNSTPLLQQGSSLSQLFRQVEPVRIDGARISLAPTGIMQPHRVIAVKVK